MVLDNDSITIKLVFLDTNALSNLISNYKGFRDNILKSLTNSHYIFCFSMDNAMEIKQGCQERYEAFVKYFSSHHCYIFKYYPDIIKEEVCYANTKQFNIFNIVYPIIPNYKDKYSLEYVLENHMSDINESLYDEKNLLDYMNRLKNGKFKYSKFDKVYEIEMIKDTIIHWNYELRVDIDLNDFPAIRIINKSFYDRIVNGKSIEIKRSDLHDIMISSVSPYVNIMVTEAFQINIIEKAKRLIPQIENLKLYRVSDFYA